MFRKDNNNRLITWRAAGIDNLSTSLDLKTIPNAQGLLPILKNNGRMNVQNKVLHRNNNKVANIYIVYKLDPISFSRNTDYTIQNVFFGAIKVTKNTDSSKNKYEGYGICFDESGAFSSGNITNARNVLIFGVDMSSSVHDTNKANNIYVLGKEFVQGINDTTLYAEKNYKTNFTEPNNKLVLSLHYSSSNSDLFVNGTQELKFKSKDDQILKEELCIGKLSSDWTTTNSEKTGLYVKIYDFVVDYQGINGAKQIYDMHRYLMTKHSI